MSISKKRPVNQLEPFEKPCFIIVIIQGMCHVSCHIATLSNVQNRTCF
jgi:hypothetical protein